MWERFRIDQPNWHNLRHEVRCHNHPLRLARSLLTLYRVIRALMSTSEPSSITVSANPWSKLRSAKNQVVMPVDSAVTEIVSRCQADRSLELSATTCSTAQEQTTR
eukprot:GHUV01055182.1.p1 GENE.GHUV01055182.1~~GHUV01055182.1.p1  ORF type:complete len:106 (+),score=2.33 GHUV01055182.1:588-905(+)